MGKMLINLVGAILGTLGAFGGCAYEMGTPGTGVGGTNESGASTGVGGGGGPPSANGSGGAGGGNTAKSHGPPVLGITSGGTRAASTKFIMIYALGESTRFVSVPSSSGYSIETGVIRMNNGGEL